jgi:hypothetical protein
MMIQAMRNRPNTAPCTADQATSCAGMSNTNIAIRTAMRKPANADSHTLRLTTTSTKKSVTTGNAARAVESGHAPSGS